ncbi:MAG: adenosylcobinamide-GDP ribazoletransferase [Nitrospinae bacterium]|nr:adenosylcobinamide-GDP ribazoletransferase [Nitrospinota bacterium]MBL7020432.1 adenosylcobinamide-GDP ribazoletransferase [Nitrospinaceae bacterium]
MKFLSAIGFLTILPVPARAISGDGRQVLYFPLVGLFIGCLLYGVDYLLSLAPYPEIRVVGDVLFLTVISGALHLDGLADTADGIFSHRPREQILEIMKDSRIGVMGVLALVFCVLLKLAGLAGIIHSGSLIWLILAPAMGRTAQVVGLVFISHVTSEKTLAEQFYQQGKYSLLLFCPLPFAVIFYMDWVLALAILTLFAFLLVALLLFFKNKIGGITGDTLGATTEIIETVFLLIGGMSTSIL